MSNNLIASMIWHKFPTLDPPTSLVKEIQMKIVDFFWTGEQWTRAPVLYLPVQQGGQGLMDIPSRIKSFRIQATQWPLYQGKMIWTGPASASLQRIEKLGYNKQLFQLQIKYMDLSTTPRFYQSVLNAWTSIFNVDRDFKELTGAKL